MDMFATQYPSFPVYVSGPGTSNTDNSLRTAICTHGGSHAALPSCRIFRGGLYVRRSTKEQNRMYGDRWFHFAHFAGFDPLSLTAAQLAPFLYSLFDTHGLLPQTINGSIGYRTCLASVLIHMGKAAVVQNRTISDMIPSMELKGPRITPVLPQWDLGIMLEALSKPPYEPLWDASLKHTDVEDSLYSSYGLGRKTQ